MTAWQITGGSPSAEETAALTVVLTALLTQRAATEETAARQEIVGTGWYRAHRNPYAAAGTWRGR
ncbi:acyl-CoA carboxylase subunit epsilon [Streptomyces yerevanensis]|uniref:acyl-CoA carboxylase subunit epsilon n=1 Tax=Streptomyces yerevanensis TaxID=66378 RepID=UPI000525F436|nr:acyl-CoA carboxylase subunit epsilon [Streptomyces yerevanensis]